MVNFSIKKSERAVSVAQMIVHLPTKHNTLSSKKTKENDLLIWKVKWKINITWKAKFGGAGL
jgi:hypothetical protein